MQSVSSNVSKRKREPYESLVTACQSRKYLPTYSPQLIDSLFPGDKIFVITTVVKKDSGTDDLPLLMIVEQNSLYFFDMAKGFLVPASNPPSISLQSVLCVKPFETNFLRIDTVDNKTLVLYIYCGLLRGFLVSTLSHLLKYQTPI